MSGGHFDYKQYGISAIYDGIKHLIFTNELEEIDEWNNKAGRGYTAETIIEFKRAVEVLRLAEIYAQRIDWLVSCDDSEESFHRRLKSGLGEIK